MLFPPPEDAAEPEANENVLCHGKSETNTGCSKKYKAKERNYFLEK